MRFKSWRSFGLSAALLFGAVSACDARGDGAGTSGSGGSATTGGSVTAAATTCTLTSQCTKQVCSPDGRCVDCYASFDCPMGLSCVAERCVTPGVGGDSGAGGSGGSGGSSGSPSGGSSGSGGVSGAKCAGTQVMFVIQRSGAMFEAPDGGVSYWDMVKDAIAGANGVATTFAGKLEMGALFFVRLQYEADKACPLVSNAAPAAGVSGSLAGLFDTNATEYEMLAAQEAKMDAPVPEAITAAAALLGGTAKHLVLLTSGVPDSCTLADSNCTVDLAIKAVQDAKAAGVTTHVVGLGHTDSLNAAGDDDGYRTYVRQLANAGVGKPVAKSAVFIDQCGDDASATYGEESGDAQAFEAKDATAVKTALSSILSSVCP